MTLRLAAISFSNAAPLYWDLQHGPGDARFQVSYQLPSQCAGMLERGEVDAATIPAAAYTRIPDLCIVPDIAIASRAAVRSILLVSKVEREKIRSVALDTSSMTSVALAKVLLWRWKSPVEVYSPMAPDLNAMLTEHDAALVIGDPALKIDRALHPAYDLGQEWVGMSAEPFVFAFWAVRKPSAEAARALGLSEWLRQSRDAGVTAESIASISAEWAGRLNLPQAEMNSYFTDNLYYHLDQRCLDGLQLFYRYAAECGALPAAPKLDFL